MILSVERKLLSRRINKSYQLGGKRGSGRMISFVCVNSCYLGLFVRE